MKFCILVLFICHFSGGSRCKISLLVSAIIRLIYFEISKEVFSVQGAWHTQNTQPTIVHDQSIIVNYRGASDYPAHVDALGSYRFFKMCNG
jgi:hypothetical protein